MSPFEEVAASWEETKMSPFDFTRFSKVKLNANLFPTIKVNNKKHRFETSSYIC